MEYLDIMSTNIADIKKNQELPQNISSENDIELDNYQNQEYNKQNNSLDYLYYNDSSDDTFKQKKKKNKNKNKKNNNDNDNILIYFIFFISFCLLNSNVIIQFFHDRKIHYKTSLIIRALLFLGIYKIYLHYYKKN